MVSNSCLQIYMEHTVRLLAEQWIYYYHQCEFDDTLCSFWASTVLEFDENMWLGLEDLFLDNCRTQCVCWICCHIVGTFLCWTTGRPIPNYKPLLSSSQNIPTKRALLMTWPICRQSSDLSVRVWRVVRVGRCVRTEYWSEFRRREMIRFCRLPGNVLNVFGIALSERRIILIEKYRSYYRWWKYRNIGL